MGEASRRRAATLKSDKWPGGPQRCPRCLGTNVDLITVPTEITFYSRTLAVCKCGAAWEPLDEALIWDRTDPHSCTSEPCENCAFRPGSPEQKNTEKWAQLIADLKRGGSFYCHKGVPIAPESKDVFAYPANRNELRLCRGYLNALRRWSKIDEGQDTAA